MCWKCHNGFHRKYKFEALDKPELLVEYINNKNSETISEYIKKYILNNYPDINENKIEVIPRGVNNKEYHFDYKPENVWIKNWYEEFPHLQNKFLITLPARLTRWKGQNDFIEIITKLNAMGINVHGLIVGGIDKRKKRYFHELKSLIKRNSDLRGLNVTIPYKEKVIRYLDKIDEKYLNIGAVNVIKIIDNKLFGINTDYEAFKITLKEWLDNSFNSKALILGTGGSSKSVSLALKELNIDHNFVSRSKRKNIFSYNDLS